MVRARIKTKEGRVILDVAEGVSITAKRPLARQASDKLRYQRSRTAYLARRLRDLESAIASGVIDTVKPGNVQFENPFQIQEQLTTARITASSKGGLQDQLKSKIAQLDRIERLANELTRLPKTFNDTIQREFETRKSVLRRAISSKRLRPQVAEMQALRLRSKFDARINEFRQKYQDKVARLANQRSIIESELLNIRRQLQEATQATYKVQSLQRQSRKVGR